MTRVYKGHCIVASIWGYFPCHHLAITYALSCTYSIPDPIRKMDRSESKFHSEAYIFWVSKSRLSLNSLVKIIYFRELDAHMFL